MTEKLYQQDVLQRSFSAEVLSCEPCGDAFAVVLNRSCFYPEGGGQPADHGSLNGIPVTDVQERNGLLYHLCPQPLAPGARVEGTLDWARRFDHMQQHSGEHLVSGLICSRFHCDNVGFHLGAEAVTIDFNCLLSWQQLQQVEEDVNRYLWEDHPVEINWPDETRLKQLAYRSKRALSGGVRIVTWPGMDCCACCGTHVPSSGQVGLVKFTALQKFREGVRLTLLCGGRALSFFQALWAQNRDISQLLSAEALKTAEAARHMKEELSDARARLGAQEERLFALQAQALRGAGDVLLFEENLSPDSLRRLMSAVAASCGGRCAVFSGRDACYQYAMGCPPQEDLRPFLQTMNRALQGRGGGKPHFAQGSVQASRAQIEAFFTAGQGGPGREQAMKEEVL